MVKNLRGKAIFWKKNLRGKTILGYVYENLVAQMLTAKGDKLFYHTWAQDEKHNYEQVQHIPTCFTLFI